MDLPRPEVTVTDPRRPGVLVAVEEPPPPRLGRRGAALLATVAVVGATALLAADVVRDRREQRRLDAVVDVGLADGVPGWSSRYDERTGTGTVTAVVHLVNRGPRAVRVTAAELAGLRATDEPSLESGGDARLRLTRTVPCPRDGSPPPQEVERRQLRLTLATPGGPREVALEGVGVPQGSLDDSVQRACDHPPLGESVQLAATVVRAEERSVVLRVDVANDGRVPVRLLSLVPARGLVVEQVGGDATGLPLELPVRTERRPLVRTLELRLGVVCGALLGADLLRPFEELSAIVEDAARSQITAVGVLARDPDLQLRQLAGRTCSSG